MGIPKVPSYGTVTVKALADLPARILGGTGIQVNVAGFDYRIDVDIEELQVAPIGSAPGKWTMVWDAVDQTYKRIEFTNLPPPNNDWSTIVNKPATFPPTLPIAESGVTNLVADLAARPTDAVSDGKTYGRRNGAWADVAAGVTIVVNWGDIVGKPVTFPPNPHTHPESEVTGLVADLAAREIISNKGAASGYAPLDSGSKVPSANLPAYLADAPSDGKTYGRNTATWSNITDAYTAKTGANGASNLPSGTTAQRPATTPGLIRFNTDTSTFEGYNGTSWAGIGGGVYVSITAPPTPRNGDLWWKSDAGLMLIYYDDGGSQQWVVANPSQDIAALDTRYTKKAGDTMTGDLTITKASPTLAMDKAASGQAMTIASYKTGVPRWIMQLGDAAAESGSNAGSDFSLFRYTDAGVFVDTPLAINRATGNATFAKTLTVQASANIYGGTCGVYSATSGGSPSVSFNDVGGTNRGSVYWSAANGLVMQNLAGINSYISLDQTTNFNFVGSANAYKSGGGSWTAPSDARIKTVTAEYQQGLDDVLKLRPVVYVYKGNDGPPGEPSPNARSVEDQTQFIGLVAQEVETVFPGMVHTRPGFVDGQPVDDLRQLDTTELIFALVNAVKTLAARVQALESR